ncbi:Aspartic peptidase domain superfamily, partial [Sesbania bispinosa]
MSLDGMTNTEDHNSEILRLKGRIKGVPILILVDSRATHNFISKRLIETMGWPVDDSKEIRVKLGDGHKTRAWGKCKDLKVEIGDTKVIIDAHLFDLGDVDLVLGMAWLSTLGETLVDWTKKTMK